MKLLELHACIDAEPSLELVGVEVDEALIYVRHTNRDGHTLVYQISLREMDDDATWAEIELVLTGHRPPGILVWMSRIVGYFSAIKRGANIAPNWNKSKFAELADRQKGDYRVE